MVHRIFAFLRARNHALGSQGSLFRAFYGLFGVLPVIIIRVGLEFGVGVEFGFVLSGVWVCFEWG